MAGYLNLIHPPQAQVSGAAELDYLQSSDTPASAVLEQIHKGGTVVVIMAEGLERRAQQQEMTNSAISGLECTYNGDCD